MKNFIFIAIFSVWCGFGWGEFALPSQEVCLHTFLRVLMKESEGGYVFFGKKPVCIHGYCRESIMPMDSTSHREEAALRVGASFWKDLKPKNADEVVIHITETEDPVIRGMVHVLVINVPLFHEVVNQNIALFQYVLGPEVTSDGLLQALLVEDRPFHHLLKYDKTLIGIVLGFGAQNSLYGSRFENIHENWAKDSPPFRSAMEVKKEFWQEYLPHPPSFGFVTTQKEAADCFQQMSTATPKLSGRNPSFVFGCLKNRPENKKLLADLEETQDKILNWLDSGEFTKTLECLVELDKREFKNSSQSEIDPEELNRVFAKWIWNDLENPANLSFLMEGLDHPELQNLSVDRAAFFYSYLTDLIDAKKNLQQANEFFQTLHSNKEMQCIVPFGLYYKTVHREEDSSETIHGIFVNLDCSIMAPSGHCVGHYTNENINLRNTVQGFAHGLTGMHTGETREIYIHPRLAYGFDSTSLEKCIYLKAVVTLNRVYENEEQLPNISPLNLDFVSDAQTLETREKQHKDSLVVRGAIFASHMKKSKDIDLGKVREYLLELGKNEKGRIDLSETEQNLINAAYWNIYFTADS